MGLHWGPHTALPKNYTASSELDNIFSSLNKASTLLLQLNRELEQVSRDKWNFGKKLEDLYNELEELVHVLHNSRELSISFHDSCARLRDKARAMMRQHSAVVMNDFDFYFTFINNYNFFMDNLRPIFASKNKSLPNPVHRPNPTQMHH